MKSDLRASLLKKRNLLSPAFQIQASEKITKTALQFDIVKKAEHIGLYWAHESEVKTHMLIAALLEQRKKIYLPRVNPRSKMLRFFTYRAGDVVTRNAFGILEPKLDPLYEIAAADLDVVFVPLVGFTEKGDRLGSGAGYYDATFAFVKKSSERKPVLIGLGYAVQKLARLKTDEWDVRLNGVASELIAYIIPP